MAPVSGWVGGGWRRSGPGQVTLECVCGGWGEGMIEGERKISSEGGGKERREGGEAGRK